MESDSKPKLAPSSSKESDKFENSELKSVIDSAEPLDCFKPASSGQALDISWCFGFNHSLPVHNISHGTRRAVFYVAGHTGVLLDLEGNRQRSLKCHSHPITCTAVSKDRRWLVTADAGRDCCLTIWDSFSGVPVKTVYQGLGKGIVAAAFSSDAKYLATVTKGPAQCVAIWDWTTEGESPSVCVTLDPHLNSQEHVVFCEEDAHQIMTTGDEQVVFYHWKDNSLLHHTPSLTDKDFNRTLGFLSGCSFLPGTTIAVSTTTEGSAVVWEVEQPESGGLEKAGKVVLEPHIRKPLKLMKMHATPITAVTTVDSYLVTGDSVGDVKFFDSDLKLINWFDSLKHGPIASLSFGFLPKAMRPSLDGKRTTVLPRSTQCTVEVKAFSVPDFVISTSNACLAYVDVTAVSSQLIFSEHDAAINALAAHPKEPRLLIGSYSCKLKLWSYEKRLVAAVRTLGEQHFIQCVAFDPSGAFVGVGCTNGMLFIVDAITLEDVCEPFMFSKDCITHVAFSQDSSFLATADLDYCVTVYALQTKEEGEMMWSYLGRQRPHYKPITALNFGVSAAGGTPRLLSLSQDRALVEYDLASSSQDDLRLLAADRIEQSAIPLTLEWYPSLSKEPFIVTANDQYKLKLYNATTKMCRKTLLGPLYGSPLRKMLVLPSPVLRSEAGEEVRRYLTYITKDKVGLMLLPHDGNPHNSVAFIAHPEQVTDVVCSFDGRHVFTSGGEDCIVNMWTVNTDALEASAKLGGEGLNPFYAMLDGGRDGEFFAELEDYFYYAQIISQGPATADTRQVSVIIPLDEVPSVMRAIGYYPTEQEVEDMMNEVKFSQYVDTGKYVTSIGLGDFIKLYVNHRPAFGLSQRELVAAFRALGMRTEGREWAISRAQLLSLLQECGEGFVDAELAEHLMVLLGYSSDPEVEGNFTEDVEKALGESLPQSITTSKFAEDILGFQLEAHAGNK